MTWNQVRIHSLLPTVQWDKIWSILLLNVKQQSVAKNDWFCFVGLFSVYCHSCKRNVAWSMLDDAETVRCFFYWFVVLCFGEKLWLTQLWIQQDLLQCVQASQFRSRMGTTCFMLREFCRDAVHSPWWQAWLGAAFCIRVWWLWRIDWIRDINCLERQLWLILKFCHSWMVIFRTPVHSAKHIRRYTHKHISTHYLSFT